jgi:hypothetical protein
MKLPNFAAMAACMLTGPLGARRPASSQMMEKKMKNLSFAALAALSLSVAVIPAYAHDFHNGSSVAGDLSATNRQQTGSYSD